MRVTIAAIRITHAATLPPMTVSRTLFAIKRYELLYWEVNNFTLAMYYCVGDLRVSL